MPVTSLLLALMVITAPRDSAVVHVVSPSVAWIVARFDTIPERFPDSNDEFMSLGPPEALPPDTTTSTGSRPRIVVDSGPHFRRLRVTIGSSERITWARIDDVATGRADRRWVRARWMLQGWAGPPVSRLRGALSARRVERALPDQPIEWIDPRTFRWIASTDTLEVRQLDGALFRLEMHLVQ